MYLCFRGPKWKQFERYSLAADSISVGDIVSSKIRSTNNWSLLPAQVFTFYLSSNSKEIHLKLIGVSFTLKNKFVVNCDVLMFSFTLLTNSFHLIFIMSAT